MTDKILSSPIFWSAFMAAFAILTLILNRKDRGQAGLTAKFDEFNERLDKFREIEDCERIHGEHDKHEVSFRQRIGKELDGHGEDLIEGSRRMTRLEKGIIFLVKEAGGDPASMGFFN